MTHRIGHLVVEALVVLALDAVVAKLDSLADQNPSTRVAVVVGKLRSGHGDGETGYAGQRREQHFGLHLRLTPVTNRVCGVAGELHKQVGVPDRVGFLVFDPQQQLASGASAWHFVELADAGDGVTGSQCT